MKYTKRNLRAIDKIAKRGEVAPVLGFNYCYPPWFGKIGDIAKFEVKETTDEDFTFEQTGQPIEETHTVEATSFFPELSRGRFKTSEDLLGTFSESVDKWVDAKLPEVVRRLRQECKDTPSLKRWVFLDKEGLTNE